ncbi:MAG TPA: radical SAM protein [Elusimicrobiota bacterium]|nr:radical SAM protein [Elusimicrobiota bacterium]
MKITLVLSPMWCREAPPLGLAALKAYLQEQGHNVRCFDFNNEFCLRTSEKWKPYWGSEHGTAVWTKEDFAGTVISAHEALLDEAVGQIAAREAKLVGFSVYATNALLSLEMARRLKKKAPDVFVVFGGPWVTQEREKVLKHPAVDAAVLGEGEGSLAELARSMDQGRPLTEVPGLYLRADGDTGVSFKAGTELASLDALPFPDFSDFPVGTYDRPRRLLAYFSRGCFKKCVFCDVPVHWKKWRCRSGRRVFEDLRHQLTRYPDIRAIEFCEATLNSDLRALEDFCDLVIADKKSDRSAFRRIFWFGFAHVRPEMDRPFLEKMARAGCHHLRLGIESGSQKVVDSMKKGYRLADAERLLADMRSAGIKALLTFMVGFPTETEEDFQGTLDFLRRNARLIERVTPNESFTAIFPGTPLHRQAESFGVELGAHSDHWRTKDGSNDFHVRLARHERFCREAAALGLALSPSSTKVARYRDDFLADYEETASSHGWTGPREADEEDDRK